MISFLRRYAFTLSASFSLLLATGVVAVATERYWLLTLPFAWILLPLLYDIAAKWPAQLFWLMLVSLPLASEIQFTPSLGMDIPDELLLIVLTGLFVLKTVFEPSWFPKNVLLHPLFFLLVLHIGWVIVACCFSTTPLLSVKYLLAKTWYIIPLVILPSKMLRHKDSFRWLALCLVVPMLFVVVQTLIRHSLYGFSFRDIKYVFFPFFRNHVNYSSMLVCLLAVAWCMWRLTPAEHAGRKWLSYGMVIGIVALVFSFSRGAWVALLAGAAGGFIIHKNWLRPVLLTGTAIAVAIVCWLVTDHHFMQFRPAHDQTVFHTDFGEHMSATLKGKDISNAERFYRWVAGGRMVAERPLTGFGPNAFYSQYRFYTVRSFETWVSNNPEHSSVHNYFLLVALEQGWPGLILFCLLLAGMLLYAEKLYHDAGDPYRKHIALTVGVVLCMIASVNMMSDMIETDKIGGLFWLCLGVMVAMKDSSSWFESSWGIRNKQLS